MYKIKRKLVIPSGTYFFTVGFNDSVYYEHLLNGVPHRNNGPAIEGVSKKDKLEVWYKYGRLHRLDGPALINNRFHEHRWYIDDTEYTEKEWENIRCLKFDIQV